MKPKDEIEKPKFMIKVSSFLIHRRWRLHCITTQTTLQYTCPNVNNWPK